MSNIIILLITALALGIAAAVFIKIVLKRSLKEEADPIFIALAMSEKDWQIVIDKYDIENPNEEILELIRDSRSENNGY